MSNIYNLFALLIIFQHNKFTIVFNIIYKKTKEMK